MPDRPAQSAPATGHERYAHQGRRDPIRTDAQGVTAQEQQVVARHAKPSAVRAATRRPSPEPMVTERLTPIKEVMAAIARQTGVPS